MGTDGSTTETKISRTRKKKKKKKTRNSRLPHANSIATACMPLPFFKKCYLVAVVLIRKFFEHKRFQAITHFLSLFFSQDDIEFINKTKSVLTAHTKHQGPSQIFPAKKKYPKKKKKGEININHKTNDRKTVLK